MSADPAPLLVPGFLTISVVDHATGTTHLAWHMQGHSSTARGRVHVPLGERTRPFQVRPGAQGPAWLAAGRAVPVLPGTLGSLPPPCCPQVELLGLVDLQDSESAAIDNVTFVQCHLDMVPPGAMGMASGAWAGRTAMGRRGPWPPCLQRWIMLPWGCLVTVTLSPAQGQDHGAEALRARAEHTSSPRTPAWGEPGEWGRGAEEKGHLQDPFSFGVPYSHSLTTVTSLWPALSCNFERGMCGWYQDQSSDFKWVHGTGQGQGSDHTTGLGKGLAPLLGTLGSPGHPAASCPKG